MPSVSEILEPLRVARRFLTLPREAQSERRSDNRGLPVIDPGIESSVSEGIAWIGRAQDNSASHDGGVARDYSLIQGWNSSYPETTGYIIPTLIIYANLVGDESVRERARLMLEWLVSIQFDDGGFQGGVIGATPVVPVTFNTGQIVMGLAAGVKEFGDRYSDAMYRAANWLVETQDADGCWRRFPSPFAEPGEKVYETHVAWGLLEAARVSGEGRFADAALANVRWALGFQRKNGWFDSCCLSDASQPLTHTLGYVLRGILEAFLFTKDPALLPACQKTADGLLTAIDQEGFLPGRLNSNWTGTVNWSCLTGTVQIASCWLELYRQTGNVKYREVAFAANRYVRRTLYLGTTRNN
jgi:hypothetical protein